jgi:hypothetical protein
MFEGVRLTITSAFPYHGNSKCFGDRKTLTITSAFPYHGNSKCFGDRKTSYLAVINRQLDR